MIPGPTNDDRYRMVEDEFLQIANRFTTHLHRAEYNRLKALTKSQNAAVIREIERPVVPMQETRTAKARREATKRMKKQREALRETGGHDGGDAPWLGTSLQGLMESPIRENRALSASFAGSSSTRAAAGFQSNTSGGQVRRNQRRRPSHSPSDSSTDGISSSPPQAPIVRGPAPVKTPQPPARHPVSSASSRSINASNPRSRGIFQESPAPARQGREVAVSSGREYDDDDPFGIHQRRVHRQKSREQVKAPGNQDTNTKNARDTMPSFL